MVLFVATLTCLTTGMGLIGAKFAKNFPKRHIRLG